MTRPDHSSPSSRAVASQEVASSLEIKTDAPARRNCSAIARPIPRVDPVTIATLPFSSNNLFVRTVRRSIACSAPHHALGYFTKQRCAVDGSRLHANRISKLHIAGLRSAVVQHLDASPLGNTRRTDLSEILV